VSFGLFWSFWSSSIELFEMQQNLKMQLEKERIRLEVRSGPYVPFSTRFWFHTGTLKAWTLQKKECRYFFRPCAFLSDSGAAYTEHGIAH
jgi:hypothetical protein